MSEDDLLCGGCLCGAVRYEVRGPAVQTTLCHCEDCRRASGAPVVAWTFFRRGALAWSKGCAKVVHFAGRERSFCGDCGTPLMFYDPAIPEWFEVNTCSFDDPLPHAPADECWTEDRLPWVGCLGRVPAFPNSSPLPGES